MGEEKSAVKIADTIGVEALARGKTNRDREQEVNQQRTQRPRLGLMCGNGNWIRLLRCGSFHSATSVCGMGRAAHATNYKCYWLSGSSGYFSLSVSRSEALLAGSILAMTLLAISSSDGA